MKKTNLLYLLVFGLILCSFKCTDDEEELVDQRVVGTWYGKRSYNNPAAGIRYQYLMVTFNNDNTGTLEYESPLGLGVGSFVWTTSKNQVSCYNGAYVNYEGVVESDFSMKLRIEGDRLIPEDKFTSFILTRDGSVETDGNGNEIIDYSDLLQNVWVETDGKSVIWFKDDKNVVEYRFEDKSNPDIYSFRRNTQYSYYIRDGQIRIENMLYDIIGLDENELTLLEKDSPFEMHMYDIGTKQDIPVDEPTTHDAGYAVDLGLPSGVKWANCNVGASSPEGFGGYYAWGETYEKDSYTEADYTYYSSSKQEWINIGSNIGGTNRDVARKIWGGDWRMPTKDEIKELIDECSWQWTSINKVNGYRITGPNGNSIFIPAAGIRNGTRVNNRGLGGFYWSGTLTEFYSGYVYGLYFNSDNWDYWHDSRRYHSRYYGFSVRPVCGVFKSKVVGEAVDLGLSVKWASCNVGAESPEDYGGYYAWGETEEKNDYSSSTSITYGLSTSELRSKGIIDTGGNLTAAYDAATDNWGSSWRMPTCEEIEELVDKCTWQWTSVNGVNGQKVTGPNGNSIFLPAAGYRYGTEVGNRGSRGYCWSGTLSEDYSDYACCLYFHSGIGGWDYWSPRYNGLTVRPVTDK